MTYIALKLKHLCTCTRGDHQSTCNTVVQQWKAISWHLRGCSTKVSPSVGIPKSRRATSAPYRRCRQFWAFAGVIMLIAAVSLHVGRKSSRTCIQGRISGPVAPQGQKRSCPRIKTEPGHCPNLFAFRSKDVPQRQISQGPRRDAPERSAGPRRRIHIRHPAKRPEYDLIRRFLQPVGRPARDHILVKRQDEERATPPQKSGLHPKPSLRRLAVHCNARIYYQSCIVNVSKVAENKDIVPVPVLNNFRRNAMEVHHERTAPAKSLNRREHLWRLDCVAVQHGQAFLFRQLPLRQRLLIQFGCRGPRSCRCGRACPC
jgi:hypothetical protein